MDDANQSTRPPWESESPEVESAPARVKRSQRPAVAGVLLLFLVGLGLFQGLTNLALDYDPTQNQLRTDSRLFLVRGLVEDDQGRPIVGATVHNVLDNTTRVTDANGSFQFERMPAGYLELMAAAPGHSNTTFRAVVLQDLAITIVVASSGEPRSVEHDSLDWQRTVVRILGGAILVLTGITAAGAISAYRRRPRWLAMVGAVSGLFVGLPLSIVIAPAAIILVARSRADFV